MLATLERPVERLAGPVGPRPGRTPLARPSFPSPVPRLRLVDSGPSRSLSVVPLLAPVLEPVRPAAAPLVGALPPARLRMTMRARRLLAVLVLLCAGAVGIVAVDLLAAVVPSESGTSYAAQEAPYVPEGRDDSGALVPSSGSTITVDAGDTLWGLAEQVDPDADPRDVIAAIMTLNDLESPTIEAGQVLRLP